jgi:hypothetical protein
LTATIGHLVDQSLAGLSARQLAQKLGHPCHPVLTHLQWLDKVPRKIRQLIAEPAFADTLCGLFRKPEGTKSNQILQP